MANQIRNWGNSHDGYRFIATSTCVSVLVVLFFAGMGQAVRARLIHENQRLDRALPNGEAIVVAGVLMPTPIVENPWERRMPARGVSFAFRIDHVLQGNILLQGAVLNYDDMNFSWPEALVEFEPESYCVMILRPSRTGDPTTTNPFPITSVLPAEPGDLPRTADVEELKRMYVKQVLKKLRACNSPPHQRSLIKLGIRYMTARDAKALIPFLECDDQRVRRSALAGLAYTTGEERYVRRAAEDLDDELKFIIRECTYRASARDGVPLTYPLFRSYFFLRPDYDECDRSKLAPLLPLFRAVADNYNPDIVDEVWEYGLEPLCWLGVRQDARVLYQHHDDEDLSRRNQVLCAISRILKLGLPEYDTKNFLRHESDLQEKVRHALEREEILPKKKKEEVSPDGLLTSVVSMP